MNRKERRREAARQPIGKAATMINVRIRYTECPLCGAMEVPFLLKADCTRHPLYQPLLPPTMNWLRCAVCRHVFTDGYFTPEALAILFSRTNTNQQVGFDIERQRPISARMVQRVVRHVNSGAWLDVGFGNASLLFTAAEFGFISVGIDLRETNVTALQRIGIEAHCINLEQFEAPGRFSVISFADVLEHMPFPKIGLQAAARLLKSGGVLLVSMPNMDAPLWHALDVNKANPYWGEIEHYHNFGRRRLYILLQEHGFQPLEYGVSERYRACMEVIAIRE